MFLTIPPMSQTLTQGRKVSAECSVRVQSLNFGWKEVGAAGFWVILRSAEYLAADSGREPRYRKCSRPPQWTLECPEQRWRATRCAEEVVVPTKRLDLMIKN